MNFNFFIFFRRASCFRVLPSFPLYILTCTGPSKKKRYGQSTDRGLTSQCRCEGDLSAHPYCILDEKTFYYPLIKKGQYDT